jgi:hypothetical protein
MEKIKQLDIAQAEVELALVAKIIWCLVELLAPRSLLTHALAVKEDRYMPSDCGEPIASGKSPPEADISCSFDQAVFRPVRDKQESSGEVGGALQQAV